MAVEKSRRSGVALIVVLGLVAILMIVSVAFTIHMRVERAGAANLRHASIARQVVKGGMAAALMAIDKQAGNSAVPEWYDPDDATSLTYNPFKDNSDVKGQLWRDTFISFDTNNPAKCSDPTGYPEDSDKFAHKGILTHGKYVSGGLDARIFTKEVEKYFPAGLAYRGFATEYHPAGKKDVTKWVPIIQPQWQPVFADSENDNVMGRYAFFALDTTGLLDVSCMTNGANARWMGRDPGEMDVSLLPDVKNAKEFAAKNFENGTYETLAEFATLMKPYLDEKKPNRSFKTLSYDPGPTNDFIYIGGSANDLKDQKADIIQAFVDCGLTAGKSVTVKGGDKTYKFPEQACWAYLGLVDYVDDDDVMEDDGVDIEPSARPATERMPLVSGFFALLTVEAKHKRTKNSVEDASWKETEPVQVKFSAQVKVPFVFPFFPYSSFPPGLDKGLELEGKAVLQARSKGGSESSKKEKRRTSPKDPSECIVQTIMINQAADDGWIDVVKFKKGTALPEVKDQLELPDVEAILRVGGATFRSDTLQHSFPAGKNNYGYTKGDKEVGFDDGMGMVVQIVGKRTKGNNVGYRDVWFDENVQSKDPEETTDPETKVITQTRFWETNIVVWAEIVDPRFASKAIVEHADEVDGQLMSSLFKASHSFDMLGSDPHHALSVLKLQAEAPNKVFNGFNDAKEFEKRCQKNPKKEFGQTDANKYDFGWYFDRVGEGISPFMAYLLEHPKAVKEFYGMPMDGIQIQNGDGAGITTDAAEDMLRMYVKNGPLESVGELGYLPIGMWQTIRLYDYCDDFGIKVDANGEKRKAGEPFTDRTAEELYKFSRLPQDPDSPDPAYGYFHPVLDYFTVVSGSIEGRININTLNSNILAVAFHNMPIFTEDVKNKGKTSYRIDSGITDLEEMPSRKYLAESIIAYRKDMKRGFGKLSELGYLFSYGNYSGMPMLHGGEGGNVSYPVAAVAKTAKGSSWGEFERESVIRNSSGLFTMRGQTFIVVVRGESYSAPFGRKKSMKGGTSNSSKTAIAEVWRDSIPDKYGHHPMFVQFFKIIDD